ncbi:MAG: hypothetical protein GIW99_00045 [Candidatus Eremiobacteraeota bacterium]|nr:hypothetical protein [Candidatus Eremiobacteraeota bacterium]
MVDWADKYPRDGWLPSAIINFAKLLESKQQAEFDSTAIDLLFYASHRYAGNRYGNDALRTLRDYQQTPDFTFAGPYDPNATPTPSATTPPPSAAPSPTAPSSATPSPAASAVPSSSATSSPSPNAPGSVVTPLPSPQPSPSASAPPGR